MTGLDGGGDTEADGEDETPAWVDEVVELARPALGGGDLSEAREAAGQHGFGVRLRDTVLVLYPEDWLEDGVVRPDVDVDRAFEVDLADTADRQRARERNEKLLGEFESSVERGTVDDVAVEDVVFNVRRFAEFCANHHGVAVDEAGDVVEEFVSDYYVRNVWASESQREALVASLDVVFDWLDVDVDPCSLQGDRMTS